MSQATQIDQIKFGTDGWRAIIGEDFNENSLARAVDAAARLFASEAPGGTLLVGYDCRQDAAHYAELAARVAAKQGLKVKLSNAYCPTPCLCWSVNQDQEACGGLMLTSSHNPAEWLGLKLRMVDGGASPKEFSDKVEALLEDEAPEIDWDAPVEMVDLVTPYLDKLKSLVDAEAIRAAKLRVVIDPLYGAGRGYLAPLMESLGVEVCEIHGDEDPTFQGLHPEPIKPWVDGACAKVVEGGYMAAFITDGDADRIGAVDEKGNFVNPHRILTLMVSHLVEDKGLSGRVVTTVSGTDLIRRQCERLGLPYTITPVGFKWIYGEMLEGDVLIGGEESGGMGMPTHVRERDGLLMALMLAETMAQRHMTLGQLVDDMFDKLGSVDYLRRDLRLAGEEQKAQALQVMASYASQGFEEATAAFAPTGKKPVDVDRRDGLKLIFDDGAWLLLRASGTEPLIRVYAEAENLDAVNALLDVGCSLVS